MKKKVFVITILSLFAIYTCNAQNDSSRSKNEKKNSKSVTTAPLQFNTFKDTVSYLIGTDLAKNFKNKNFLFHFFFYKFKTKKNIKKK